MYLPESHPRQLDDSLMLENIVPKYLPFQAEPKMTQKSTAIKKGIGKSSVFTSPIKPKRCRESRARQFYLEEIFCFDCKIQFKKPQSLISHTSHRHGLIKKVSIRF